MLESVIIAGGISFPRAKAPADQTPGRRRQQLRQLHFLSCRFAAKAPASHGSAGSSLMEMVVALAILSLLAAMAAPYAKQSFRREKEIQLRETLRTVRTAIDRFHADMDNNGTGQKDSTTASENGYPLSLKVLVEGVVKSGKDKKRKIYLRSLPVNPFVPAGTAFEAQWAFVSYELETLAVASSSYGATLAETQKTKKDIYDLHAVTPGIALDGTRYADW